MALPNSDQIAVVDATTYTEIGRLLVADSPLSLTAESTTGRLYVGHEGSAATIGVLAIRSLEGEIPEEFSESFDSATLSPSWAVVSGQGSFSSLAEGSGHLRVLATEFSGPKPPPSMTRMFRGDRWTLEVKASYFTGKSGGSRVLFFGISLGAPPVPEETRNLKGRKVGDGVYIYRSSDDWNGCCPGETRQYFLERGKLVSMSVLPSSSADAYVWRIRRDGRNFTIERSDDGVDYKLVGAHSFDGRIDKAIQFLFIGHHSFGKNDAYADFDYIRLTKTLTQLQRP